MLIMMIPSFDTCHTGMGSYALVMRMISNYQWYVVDMLLCQGNSKQ